MTISAVVPDIAFAGSSGSGTMGPFSLVKNGTPIVFFSNSEVVVLRYDTVTDTAPVLLVEGTDYTLTGGPSSGSITLTSPQTGLLTDERLYVTTLSALAQNLDLVNGGNFSSSNLERRLDIIFQVLQQHAREIKSTIRFAMFDTDEIPKTTPLGAAIGKVAYPTGTAANPSLGLLDVAALADLVALNDEEKANLSIVAADIGGADTIGIVAADIAEVGIVADNIGDVGTVATAITDGTIEDLLGGNTLLEWMGGGAGNAALDQAAIAAAAAAGQHVRLLKGVTYYMTAGVTPVTGFGITFEPGSKIVAVTQASGSGSAGFKNYSGAAAARNSVAGTMFMLTASGGRFTFVNPTFEGDNSNQPILRPIYGNGSYLYIHGQITVTNMNAANGCLSLDQMLGGFVEGYDLRANADMVDSAYTNLTSYSPAGIVLDDDGTNRSSRMYFGPGVVKGFNRDAGGTDPTQSDGITIGGIAKPLRSGAVGGHVFGPIYVEDVGEGVDCFQDDCVFESITVRTAALTGLKFVHGAQSNVVQWLDVDTFGQAGATFAGSGDTATATRDNVILDGIVRNGGKVGSISDVCAVLFQENTGTGVARANRVRLREVVVDADTDYLMRDNHSASGHDNSVHVEKVTGSLAIRAAEVTDLTNAKLKVGGGLTRLTMSANQAGLTTDTNTTVLFDTVETDLLSEAVTANNKIRAKYPGRKLVRASIRTTLNADDNVSVRILQNGTVIAQRNDEAVSGGSDHTYAVERMVFVNENQAGTASADFTVQVRITSAGTIDLTNTAVMAFFEVMDVD